MSQAQQLWSDNRQLADRSLQHPFVQGIGDGTLERDRYRHFIAQDAFFLESFARGYAHCLARSPDRKGIYEFHELLNGIFEELKLHRQASEALDIDLANVTPSRAALDYTGFLEEVIESGGTVGETLAAMTPCMRLYAYIGSCLDGQPRPSDASYAEWVDTYAGEDFQGLANLMEQLLDRYGTGSDRERQNYTRAMELELGFFESAWKGGAD